MDSSTLEILQWGLGMLTLLTVAILGWLFAIQRDLSDFRGSIKILKVVLIVLKKFRYGQKRQHG